MPPSRARVWLPTSVELAAQVLLTTPAPPARQEPDQGPRLEPRRDQRKQRESKQDAAQPAGREDRGGETGRHEHRTRDQKCGKRDRPPAERRALANGGCGSARIDV